jgi:hypothetical protein
MQNPSDSSSPPSPALDVQGPLAHKQNPPIGSAGHQNKGSGTKMVSKNASKRSISFKNIILGLCIAVLAIVLVYAGYKYFGEAWSIPADIRVTNITSRSATVTWVTEKPTKGVVVYAEDSGFLPGILAKVGKGMALDDRDVSEAVLETVGSLVDGSTGEVSINDDVMAYVKSKSYYTHHVTIKNLDPEKTYYFRVGNGVRFTSSEDALADDQFTAGSAYSLTTFAEADTLLVPNPSYGSVISDGTDVTDGIFYMVVNYDSGQELSSPLSTTLNDEGNWYVDLSNARSLEGDLIDALSETEDFETVYVNAGPLGESERKAVRMDNDAPMPTIEVSAENGPGVQSDGAGESKMPFVSYVNANYSECVSSSNCPNMSQYNKDHSCCGCNYDDNGNKVSCGFMQYCCDASWTDDPAPDPAPTPTPTPTPSPSPGGCPAGASAADCAALQATCQSQAGVAGNCDWVPDGCAGGHFVNNACPGSQNVKCCIPETQADPEEPGSECTGPSQPDHCYIGDSCGNSGVCQGNAYGETRCEVGGLEGKYRSNLCGGGIEVRCCEPIVQESPSGVQPQVPTCPANRVCNINLVNRCDDWNASICAQPANGSSTCCCNKENQDCFNNPEEGNGYPLCKEGLICSTDQADVGKCNSYENTYVCANNNESFPYACCCENPGEDCFGEEKHTVFLPLVSGSSGEEQYQCQCRKSANDPWEDITSGSACNLLVYSTELGYKYCLTKPEDVPVKKCWDRHPKPCEGVDEVCDTSSYGEVINCDGIEYECTKGLLGVCVWDSHGRVEGCSGEDFPLNCDGEEKICNNDSYGDEIVCSKQKYLCTNVSDVLNGCDWKPQGKVDELWCTCINNVEGTIENVSADGYESCEAFDEEKNKYDGCEELTQAIDQQGGNVMGLSSSVHAQEKTYVVTDDYIFSPEEDGVYTITFPDGGLVENIVLLEGETYQFFIDGNNNGVKDEGEEYIELKGLSLEITVDETLSVFTVSLSPGLNYVSFSHLPRSADSCEFIKELNGDTEDREVTMLARFESGAFDVTSYRADAGGEVSGDCFPVVPGRGYVVRSYVSKEVPLGGFALSEPAQVGLDSPGWHLIGVNGSSRSFTALSVIDGMNTIEGLMVDNVTQWDHDSSRYEGLQKENDEVYGFDFPIDDRIGYFVRVSEGSGVWTPE